MPKNTKGGNKAKRGKNENDISKREIVAKGDGEAYAFVIAPMGSNQVSLRLEDMTSAIGVIRGALRKKTWINRGDLVRVQLRDGYEAGTVDVVGKYTHNEVGELLKQGEVSDALIQGNQADSLTTGNSKSGAVAITFTNAGASNVAESTKDKNQPDPNARNKNVDMDSMLQNLIMGGASNTESSSKKGGNNKHQEDDDDDEDEEDEEEEEEEEEENDDAKYYDDGRAAASNDWNKYHNNKKDQDYKQRNKRAKENQKGVAGGVTAADVDDI